MFAKAVRQHDAAPKRKASVLEQQLFPSSSPAACQEKSGARQRFVSPSKILRPSASILRNTPYPGYRSGSINTPRSASVANSISTMGSSWSKSDSVFSKENTVDLTQSTDITYPSIGGGRVEKLHEAVDFDEFPEDAELDLDEEEQQPWVVLPAPQPDQRRSPSHGNPYPWSSSPLQHKAALSHNGSLQRPESSAVTYPMLPKVSQSKEESEQAIRPSKRRTIPWNREGQVNEDSKKGPPLHIQKIIEQQRVNHPPVTPSEKSSFTPLPKDKSNSPYPWNKTASAVKEEQKQFRQVNKRSTKHSEGTGDESATKRACKDVARVFLSDEQRKVLALVAEQSKSVFYTGSAGTGKSVLMREIIKALREKFSREPDRVAVTASTGLAACNVGGVTLHSFAGIGLGKEAIPELVKKIKRNKKAKNRWMRTKVLIIDEISMVDGDLFDKLEGIARTIRNNGRPFGGIQLVITGDFFQLPPVPDPGKVAKFAFDAATWNTSIEHTIGLTQIFRQKDPVFASVLNEMRLGRLTPSSIEVFKRLNRPLEFKDEFEATELFPTRAEVDNANSLRMRNLGGTLQEFRASDGGSITDIEQRDRLLSNCMAPPLITLKKGAQVMLIKNIDETLVNGSLGRVHAFMDEKTFDIYHQNEEEFQAAETMDSNDTEMTQSRKKLKSLMNRELLGSTSRTWPLVRFHIADGSTRDLLCQNESWKIELPNGEVQASRSQVPLILAWALSIHKAQGQTLERVKVDLGRIFEKGQAYVALSRATCQEGLQIMRFDPKKVMAHERVRNFYNTLYNIDQQGRSDVKEKPYTSTFVKSEKVDTLYNIDPTVKPGRTAKTYDSSFVKSENFFQEDEDALEQLYG